MPSICRIVLLAVSVISLARAEERVALDIYILVSDIHVKQIEAKRTITIGLPFSFEDLQNEAPASAIKTSVSGTCELRDGAYHVTAHRVTIRDNQFVRSDWFRQVIDPATDDARPAFASISMGTATFFDIRLKPPKLR